MAYYQLNRRKIDFKDAIFVSTSGNPSVKQFQAVMEQFPDSRHHLCFDNDMAGRMFTLNFLLQLKGDGYSTRMNRNKDQLVVYDGWKREPVWHIPSIEFNMDHLCSILEIDPQTYMREVPSEGYKDWNDELLGILSKRNSTLVYSSAPVSTVPLPQEKLTATPVKNSSEQNSASRVVDQPVVSLPDPQKESQSFRFKL